MYTLTLTDAFYFIFLYIEIAAHRHYNIILYHYIIPSSNSPLSNLFKHIISKHGKFIFTIPSPIKLFI